jgi:hypothetical protein
MPSRPRSARPQKPSATTKTAAKTKTPSRAPRRRVAEPAAASTVSVEAALAALRDEVAALARAVTASPETAAGLLSRLRESADLLVRAAAELPRAEEFQPLADHLYTFAQSAPRLMQSLEAVRAAVAPLEAAAGSLAEVADTLVATHQGWMESLLRLPRAEDYEPLTNPLREFARVSPLLAETLAAVVKTVTPLPALVQQVLGAAAESRGDNAALRGPLAAAADRMAAVRAILRDSLATIPREPAYGKAAAQLRELATVSPSLMEWLRQLPELTLPLGESIASLDQAAHDLDLGERAARAALED